MSSEVAERTRPGLGSVEAPGVEGRVVAPVLEIATPEVADLAELSCVDHLPRETHGGDETVVEGAEMLDAGCCDSLPDVVALVCGSTQGLLAEDMLARLCGGDRRLRVEGVRASVVEEADRRVGDDVSPVCRPALVAVSLRCPGDRVGVASRNRHEARDEGRWPRHVRDLPEGVRMGLAHERVAEHPDPDLLDLAERLGPRDDADPSCSITHVPSPLRQPIRFRDTRGVMRNRNAEAA